MKAFTPTIRHILLTLDNLNARLLPDYPKDWTITSINDSTHSPTSKHYADLALDMRSKNFMDEGAKRLFVIDMQQLLGLRFYVLYENPKKLDQHFHIQLKKGAAIPDGIIT